MHINKKIFRTIGEHKPQYLGAICLIAFGCFIFSLFHIFGSNLFLNLEWFKTQYRQESAHFITQSKLENIDMIEKKYNVLIEERLSLDLSYNEKTSVRLLSETKKVNLHYIVSGNPIENKRDVLIDKVFANTQGFHIGDKISLGGETFFVAGLIASPDYIYGVKTVTDMVKNPETFGYAVVNKNVFEDLEKESRYYSIYYKEIPDIDLSNLKSEINQSNFIINWVDRKSNNRIVFIENDLKGIAPISTYLPIIIMLITSVFVSVILGRLIKQEHVHIGLLFALGYRKKEILFHYIKYAIIISIIGGFLGTLSALLLIKPYINFASNFFNLPIFKIEYDYNQLILSLILPFVFLIPTSIRNIIKALKASPLDLLRNNVDNDDLNFLEQKVNLEKYVFKNQFKMREILRNIPSVLLLISGVIVSSSLILFGFIMKDSLDNLISENLSDVYKYNYQYFFNTLQFDKVKDGELSTFGVFDSKDSNGISRDIIIQGIDPESKFFSFLDSGNNGNHTKQNIFTKTLANQFDLQIGDTIEVANSVTRKRHMIRVDAIAEVYTGSTIYMPFNEVNLICEYPKDSYLQVFSLNKLNFDPSLLISVSTKDEMVNGFTEMIKPLRLISFSIGFVAFIVGLIILYVIISMIVHDNRHTISMLKILGYYKKEIYDLVLNTFTYFVAFAYIITLPIILVAMNQFFLLMTKELGLHVPIKASLFSCLIGFLVVLVIYEVSKNLNRIKVNQISMADSLKNRYE